MDENIKKDRVIFLAIIFVSIFRSLALGEVASFKERSLVIQEALREEEVARSFQLAELKRQDVEDRRVQSNADGEKQKFGLPVAFHPYLNLRYSYKDNLFNVKTNSRRDLVNTITPGIRIVLGELGSQKQGRERLELDLGGNLARYQKYSQFDSQDPFGNLFFQMGRERNILKLSSGANISTGSSSDYVTGQEGTTKSVNNKQNFSWESSFSRLALEISAGRGYTEPVGEFKAAGTKENQDFASLLYWKLLPKTSFFLGYNYGWVDYNKDVDKTKNSHYDRYWVGVKGEISKKIAGIIKIGVEDRNFKGQNDSDNDIAFVIDLKHTLTVKDILSFTLSQGGGDPSRLAAAYSRETSVSSTIAHKISERLSCGMGARHGKTKDSDGTKTKSYSGNVFLSYSFREWCSFNLGYVFSLSDSTEINGGYTSNVYDFAALLKF